ncbi:MAG: 23S rRNA (pseudouridine(1915)-N(3))-methyltransferase RlmH [Armatimonadetes bacterium]|nr:23S rRNA (pseudouridine(1915)-N(3))-methyltransferase RlmH [Armatimonadota bacterium]
MKAIRLVAVDKVRERYMAEGCADYAARIRRYVPLDIAEVRPERVLRETPAAASAARQREGDRLLKAAAGRETPWIAALAVQGVSLSSEKLASLLQERFESFSLPVFLIGGAFGLDDAALQAADFRFSLSSLTLPHELARLVLLEQIYRGLTILNGERYHK